MADSDFTGSEYDGPSFQSTIKDAVLAPFRALVSKSALRIYLNTLLFMGAASLLIGISAIAYGVFYFKFIPTVGLQRQVHLQFGNGHPWGTAHFDSEFVSAQPYDVSVTLEVPRTPSNLDNGNFMLDLTLFATRPASLVLPGPTNTPIAQARRPAILTYASPMVDMARRATRMPLYLVGWRRESETLEVPMMEQLEFGKGVRNLPQSLRLEIQSDARMQIYSAHVEFRARLTGLRYDLIFMIWDVVLTNLTRWLMYRWKITSFLVFSSLFWSVSMLSASLTWLVLTWVLGTASTTVIKPELDLLKEESVTEDDSDESVKKEEEEETRLHSLPTEREAMGSGLESAEARGVQKRRSHSRTN
ncbi:unnamed protein product [Penicillium salamii]|nr:unnamed protein product [Penicillium salamii]